MENTKQMSAVLLVIGVLLLIFAVFEPLTGAESGKPRVLLPIGGGIGAGYTIVSGIAGLLYGERAVRLREWPQTRFQWGVAILSTIAGLGVAAFAFLRLMQMGYR